MIKRYTFSCKKNQDNIDRIKALITDNPHYEVIVESNILKKKSYEINQKRKTANDENSQLKAENLSLKNRVRELEGQLSNAKNCDIYRVQEIDKWHRVYEHAQAEISMLRQQIEDSDSVIIATAKKYIGDNPLSPEVIMRRSFDGEEYKKKEKALEDKIKNLQEKVGNESVPLSVLAERLMDYAEEAGIRETHELFNHLNNLLINVPAWTKNVPELKKFFRKARKEMEGRNVTMTGEHATYNENNNK